MTDSMVNQPPEIPQPYVYHSHDIRFMDTSVVASDGRVVAIQFDLDGERITADPADCEHHGKGWCNRCQMTHYEQKIRWTEPVSPDTQPRFFQGPISPRQAELADVLYGCGIYQTADGQYWLPRDYELPSAGGSDATT